MVRLTGKLFEPVNGVAQWLPCNTMSDSLTSPHFLNVVTNCTQILNCELLTSNILRVRSEVYDRRLRK